MKKIWVLLLLFSGRLFAQSSSKDFTDLIQPSIFAITKVMMHDVVNPPAASRFYSYCMMGAYEIVATSDKSMPGLQKLLAAYKPEKPVSSYTITNSQITALYCILETGKLMLPSGYMIEKDLDELNTKLKNRKVSDAVIKTAHEIALLIAKDCIRYASSDAYTKLSAKLRYTPKKGEGYWYPTPPAYLEAVEPNWKTVRPFFLDSSSQFIPAPPAPYSTDKSSEFYKLTDEVYTVSKTLTKEQLHIASFWDCNPFAVENAGHLSLGFKKISPGGHWMNISGIAAKQSKLSFSQTITMQTMVAFSLADAFISCWDEKYRSHRIRPETVINKQIDIKWQPLLQTPPFPEYPSGHSVISSAAAEVLSFFLGDNYRYTDDSEMMFEIPARKFTSFRAASDEAAISRLYGGIHYRDAIEFGVIEGKKVGELIVGRLKQYGISSFKK
ncbi:MAG: vanadium-dependent haloperoxidase [Flavitalea sp.]